MTTSLSASPLPSPDLTDPLWTVEHLSRLFYVKVDTVREYTYRTDFPTPAVIGRRLLWLPDEVIGWTREQKRYVDRDVAYHGSGPAVAAAELSIKPYKSRRGMKTEAAA